MNPLVIRTSDRNAFRGCRQKWDWNSALRQDYEYLGGIAALDLGTAVHSGLETYYDPDLWTMPRDDVNQLAMASYLTTSREYVDQIVEAVNPDDVRRAELTEQVALGRGMLEHYFQWAPEQDSSDGWTPVYSEVKFQVPVPVKPDAAMRLPEGFHRGEYAVPDGNGGERDVGQLFFQGRPVVHEGRIDMIIRDKEGRLWIVDHKTAAQFGQMAFLDLDAQCSTYIWALRRVLGIPVQGVIYNQLKKNAPGPPDVLKSGNLSKNKQQKVSYHTYMQAIVEAGEDPAYYEDFLHYLKFEKSDYFRRVQTYRSDTELDIIEDTIVLEVVDMLNNPVIYPNPGMFNCNGCQFYHPCLARQDGSDVQWILNSSGTYKKRGSNNDQDG